MEKRHEMEKQKIEQQVEEDKIVRENTKKFKDNAIMKYGLKLSQDDDKDN